MKQKIKVKPLFASKKKLPRYGEGGVSTIDPLAAYRTSIKPQIGPVNPTNTNALMTGTAGSVPSTASAPVDVSGIGNIASGVGSMMMTDDASSSLNYAGDMIGNAGKGASMGAALGPWGAAAGAAIGGIYGAFDAANAEKMQNRAKEKEQINTNLASNNSMSGSVNSNYNLRNSYNDRVPGLNKGVAKFKSGISNTNQPNAMIAPEEGVMDGDTGRLSIVPGKYNTSNPDTVPANLTNGSSVFSNKQSQVLPGGKSTPADIMAKAEKMQKINDKILTPKEGERKLSRIDQLTAKLNQRNIQLQAENLNKFNMLSNPMQQQSNVLPGYARGTASSGDREIENEIPATVLRQSFTKPSRSTRPNGTRINISPADYYALPEDQKKQYRIDEEAVPYSEKGNTPGIYNYDIRVNKDVPAEAKPQSTLTTNNINTIADPTNNVINNVSNPNTFSTNITVPKGGTMAHEALKAVQKAHPELNVKVIPKDIALGIQTQNNQQKGQLYKPGSYNANLDLGQWAAANKPQSNFQPQPVSGSNWNTNIQNNRSLDRIGGQNDYTSTYVPENDMRLDNPEIAKIQAPLTNQNSTNTSGSYRFNTPMTQPFITTPNIGDVKMGTNYNSQASQPTNPETQVEQPRSPVNSPAQDQPSANFGGINKLGNSLMSLAPIAYNSWNSEPEVATPIYQNYTNPNQRYNIAPELAEATKQRQISRYGNASTNTGTGANMAYGADAYSRGNDQVSELMGKAQTVNAGYRNDYVNRYNQIAGMDASENRRIYDLNARNRAASRTFGAKNAEMLSQYGQTQQLMNNQLNSDRLNTYVYSLYNTAMTKDQRAEVNRRLNQR